MPRRLRIPYPSAIYHLMSRGNRAKRYSRTALIVSLLAHTCLAASEPVVFKTIDAQVTQSPKVAPVAEKPGPECGPVHEDPDGHWGKPSNGFQVSLRFLTNTFVLGRPIVAYVYLRNITNYGVEYACNTALAFPSCRMECRDAQGHALTPKLLASAGSFRNQNVLPGTQDRCWAGLDWLFDLKPGRYQVTALADAVPAGAFKATEIRSAPATIQILPAQPVDAAEKVVKPAKP